MSVTVRLPVVIDSLIHDLDLNTYSIEVRFRTYRRGWGRIQIPRAKTRHVRAVIAELLNAGAVLPADDTTAIEYVSEQLALPPEQTISVTRRAGWHDDTFVIEGRAFGPQSETLRLIRPNRQIFEKAAAMGSLRDWISGLRVPCSRSNFLVFGLSTAFAGPLLGLLNESEGAIFNLYGNSSTGKTLVSRALTSISGRADVADLPTYDITPRGKEELCFSNNDWIVVLDEQGRMTGSPAQKREKMRTLAFTIPGGRGGMRSERATEFPNLTWRVFGMTTGEQPLEDAGTTRFGGERLRHIDISVPPAGGIFDCDADSDNSPSALVCARAVEDTIRSNFGRARAAYLKRLTADKSVITERLSSIVAAFVEALDLGSDAYELRFARKFGVVAAAGVLAAEWRIAPFDVERAKAAVSQIYRIARRSMFSAEQAKQSVLQQVRDAKDDPQRLPHIPKGGSLPTSLIDIAWGFQRSQAEYGEIIAISPERWIQLAPSRPSSEAILDVLLAEGKAIYGQDNRRHPQLAVQGFGRATRPRWVCLRANAL